MRRVMLFLLAWLLLPMMAVAADDALYVVSDVAVDIEAANAAAARDQAFAAAQRQALALLLERLNISAPPASDASLLARLVEAVEVTSERRSTVRWLGTFTVRFNPDAVRNWLQGSGQVVQDNATPSLLVLPVMEIAGAPVLFEDRTPWRTAWDNAPADPLVPITVPAGELEDVRMIAASEALASDALRIAGLVDRYQTQGVLVARLLPLPADPQQALAAELRWQFVGAAPQQASVVIPPIVDAKATLTDRLQTLASAARHKIRQHWQVANPAASGPPQWLDVILPLTAPQDWAEAQRRLSGVRAVRAHQLLGLTRDVASLRLEFIGSAEQLRSALVPAGLDLQPVAGGWQLQLGAGR